VAVSDGGGAVKGENLTIRRIGITGGAGSGKSLVLSWLEEKTAAKVIRTDDVAKALMEPGEEGYRQVVKALGTSFLEQDGRICRPALAQIIFREKGAKAVVDQIIHPLVWEYVQKEIKDTDSSWNLVESALFGKDALNFLDEIWYIYAPEEIRAKRMISSRGYEKERCQAMFASQPSDEEYRVLASRVIDNGGSFEAAKAKLTELLLNFS
jgi:dephospho-CoA kinase